jgi:RimJ/RimL family protein N-acetyltransferase
VSLSHEVHRPLYEIEGLISFYPHFRTEPPKTVELRLCHDLSCWLRGAEARIAALRERYGEDTEIDIVEGSCIGRCDIAPAGTVNEAPVPLDDAVAAVAAARPGGNGEAGSPPMRGEIPGGSGFRPPGSTEPLTGEHVRLEPLGPHHVPGLLQAAAQDPALYQWVLVPQDEPAMRRHVEDALAARAKGIAVPFAVIRLADETVIGSTRFHQLDYWARPGEANVPDTCEIGYTWLAREALRTGANTEMKRLMLTHAFEVWRVRSVCLHTDVRNQRSQAAIRRIGGTFEGVLRSHRLAVDQSPRDSARFSITAAEWPAVRQHLADLTARHATGAARRQAAGQHPQ